MQHLTMTEIRKACENNKFLQLRYNDNTVVGINCRIMGLSKIKHKDTFITDFVSFYPINFNQYLSIKVPFIR